MITTRSDLDLVSCGRPGCLEPLGRHTLPKRWRLIGQGWHWDQAVKPPRWRRARSRTGRRKAAVREHYRASLPGGRGYDITYPVVVECPRCETPQRMVG